MLASVWGSVGMGTKEDDSSTLRVRASGFHHVTAHSHLACVLKLMNLLFLPFFVFFRVVVNRG
jgi:hypothetical protein